jgi:hypothetical protein
LFYQALIETSEKIDKCGKYKQLFELDKTHLSKIEDELIIPFLKKEKFQFDGYFIQASEVRRIQVKQTKKTTEELSKFEDDNITSGVFFYIKREDILSFDKHAKDITDQIFKSSQKKIDIEMQSNENVAKKKLSLKKNWYRNPAILGPVITAFAIIAASIIPTFLDNTDFDINEEVGKLKSNTKLKPETILIKPEQKIESKSPGVDSTLEPITLEIIYDITPSEYERVLDSLRKSFGLRNPEPLEFGRSVNETPAGTYFYLPPDAININYVLDGTVSNRHFETYKISEKLYYLVSFTTNESASLISRLNGRDKIDVTVSTVPWGDFDCVILIPSYRIIESKSRKIPTKEMGKLKILDFVLK